MQQAAARGGGQHRDRVRRAGGAQVRALERVDGDVDLRERDGGAAALERVRHPDLLADVEHRRLVALSLADHDRAVDRHRVHDLAHGLDRDLIGSVAIALPHGVRAGNRRLLDHSQKLQ